MVHQNIQQCSVSIMHNEKRTFENGFDKNKNKGMKILPTFKESMRKVVGARLACILSKQSLRKEMFVKNQSICINIY